MTRYRGIKKDRRRQRERRHRRVRKKIWGTAERPRLVVYRSRKNTEGQLVDDDEGETIMGISTASSRVRELELEETDQRKVAAAHAAGKLLAEQAREAGIEAAVFDRGGYKYHGRVKAFAEGAREGGLEF